MGVMLALGGALLGTIPPVMQHAGSVLQMSATDSYISKGGDYVNWFYDFATTRAYTDEYLLQTNQVALLQTVQASGEPIEPSSDSFYLNNDVVTLEASHIAPDSGSHCVSTWNFFSSFGACYIFATTLPNTYAYPHINADYLERQFIPSPLPELPNIMWADPSASDWTSDYKEVQRPPTAGVDRIVQTVAVRALLLTADVRLCYEYFTAYIQGRRPFTAHFDFHRTIAPDAHLQAVVMNVLGGYKRDAMKGFTRTLDRLVNASRSDYYVPAPLRSKLYIMMRSASRSAWSGSEPMSKELVANLDQLSKLSADHSTYTFAMTRLDAWLWILIGGSLGLLVVLKRTMIGLCDLWPTNKIAQAVASALRATDFTSGDLLPYQLLLGGALSCVALLLKKSFNAEEDTLFDHALYSTIFIHVVTTTKKFFPTMPFSLMCVNAVDNGCSLAMLQERSKQANQRLRVLEGPFMGTRSHGSL